MYRRLFRVKCLHPYFCALDGVVMTKTRLRALSYNAPDNSAAHRVETSIDGAVTWTHLADTALSAHPMRRVRRDPNAPMPGQLSIFDGGDAA